MIPSYLGSFTSISPLLGEVIQRTPLTENAGFSYCAFHKMSLFTAQRGRLAICKGSVQNYQSEGPENQVYAVFN